MSDSDFLELLDVVAPRETDLVTLLQAYYDESYGPDGLLCVGGCIFTKKGARGLDREWGQMLRENAIPYFRMSACAHGNDPLHKLSDNQRDRLARRAIALVTKHALAIMATTVSEPDFEAKVPRGPYIGNVRAYEFCVWNSLMHVWKLADLAELRGARVAYFFEAGHRSQKQANRLMHTMFDAPTLREQYMYMSHAFVGKEDSFHVQAADLIAWQFYQDRKRELSGRPRRKDTEALVSGTNVLWRHIDVDRHAKTVRDTMEEIAASEARPTVSDETPL